MKIHDLIHRMPHGDRVLLINLVAESTELAKRIEKSLPGPERNEATRRRRQISRQINDIINRTSKDSGTVRG